jgi:hypothetical protein
LRRPLNAVALDGLIREATDMLLKPGGQFNAAEAAGGKVEHEMLLLVDGGIDLAPAEQEKGGHRCVGHALVAVDKGVLLASAKPSAAAFSMRLRWRSFAPKVALGWVTADSRATR